MNNLKVIICLVFLLSVSAFAQSDYAVLVQENPIGAGEIKPGLGVHTFGINEVVTLSTVARPGWKFVYWLGEVSDPTANRTLLAVDGPKIIIAVFQRDELELAGSNSAAGNGIETLIPHQVPFTSGGGSFSPPSDPPDYPPYDPPDDPPDNPPVPEPQTIALMLGAILKFRNKFYKRRHHNSATAGKHQGPGPRNP